LDRSRSSAKKVSDHDAISSSFDDGPLAVGTLVAGKYEVLRKLAEGGLGIVVLAVHRELNQRVAIKYLKTEALANAALVARFHREARLAASLHSEHVVRVFDVGRHRRAGPYMVMEYLEGSDLASVMSSGRIEVATAVDYVLQACDALAEAHLHGIVHRDLKPENLFLARRGTRGTIVKVVDFGLSKVTLPAGQSGSFPRLTEQGERFGTPMFMSPEQLACSADVDARSDIWALGVVLFELLTSELPFEGLTAATLAANIFSATPRDLRSLRPDASPELGSVILRCLAKDPAGRYRDIEELAADLVPHGPPGAAERLDAIRRALRTGSVKPPRREIVRRLPPRGSAVTKIVAGAALLVTLLVVVAVIVRLRGSRATGREEEARAAQAATTGAPSASASPAPSVSANATGSASALAAVASAPALPAASSPVAEAAPVAVAAPTTVADTKRRAPTPAPAPARSAARVPTDPDAPDEWGIRFER
jgi:serine/threonine-protein kinase